MVLCQFWAVRPNSNISHLKRAASLEREPLFLIPLTTYSLGQYPISSHGRIITCWFPSHFPYNVTGALVASILHIDKGGIKVAVYVVGWVHLFPKL